MADKMADGESPDNGSKNLRRGGGTKRSPGLSAAFVRTVRSPGRYCDGNGLNLAVQPSGSKQWVQRLTIHRRRRELGLGGYPLVSLAEARVAAFENRKLARAGGDPLALKRVSAVPAFEQAAHAVIELHRPSWRSAKHAAQWSATLAEYAFPRLGKLSVAAVTASDVMEVLKPIWHTKPETARRVRQRISAVMKWAVAQGFRADNPAGDAIGAALPRNGRSRRHHRALPHCAVAAAVAAVRTSNAGIATKLAFEFLVLTAARSGEIRLATWAEIDTDSRQWSVPGERMKAGQPHRVPLCNRARALLAQARTIADGSGLVFPSPTGRALSDATLSKLLRELGIDAVPHGFRSSFRDWAGEFTNAPRAVMEAALAHTVRDKAEAAYARSDLFERRRALMEQWETYLSTDAGALVPAAVHHGG